MSLKLPRIFTVILSIVLMVALVPGVVAQEDGPVLTDLDRQFAAVYERVSPSVVAIEIQTDAPFGDGFEAEDFVSGFVFDRDGHIITNYSLLDGGQRYIVNFFDGTIVEAEVVGFDRYADIAVMLVDLPPDRLQPVEFADSDSLRVGQTALTIGSPFGQTWTLTRGIISALDRRIIGVSDFNIGAAIQTDAAVNLGNSGGPLLNLDGEVIGVNAQVVSAQQINSGVGLAVPSNLIQRVASEVIQFGEADYSYLGIQGLNVDLAYIEQYNLPENLRGVVVSFVNPNQPADRGGLQANSDVIVAIDDQRIESIGQLIGYLSSNTTPDQEIQITVLRNGREITLDVILGSRLGR
jgi:2-alkenal reductase